MLIIQKDKEGVLPFLGEVFLINVIQKIDFISVKKNLFIISNEIQLINALEARAFYQTENTIFLFLELGHNKDIAALSKYKKILECNQLLTFTFHNNSTHIKQDIKLIQYLKQYTYHKIFIGYFSTRIRQYLANLEYIDITLLDDGTYTLALHNELYKGLNGSTPSMLETSSVRHHSGVMHNVKKYKKHYMRKLFFGISGLKYNLLDNKINFFTIFDLEQIENERIDHNSYSLLKDKYQNDSTIISNEKYIYFLGQTLNKSLGISPSAYINNLKKIIFYYKNKDLKIKYIPHRSEKKSYRDAVELLCSSNFTIYEINKPFEIFLLEEQALPYRIASFFSSGLFTSKIIYPELILDSFKISFDEQKREDISLIYKAIVKESISLIKL